MGNNNTKKLVGAIIGVTLFAALIAGATYAWFTFNADVTNGVYNTKSKNFMINYTKGTDISDVPILADATPTTAKNLMISAKLQDNNSVPGKLTIKLNSTSTGTLTTSGAIKYKICTSSSTTSSCTSNFDSAVASGAINAKSDITIYADTNDLTTSLKYYFIYFWVDASLVDNGMLQDANKSYSGYIHASATQNH